MQSRGSAGVPPPPPAFIEFKRRLAKKEREAKLAVEKERATAAEREKAATAEARAREIAQANLAVEKERAAVAEREKAKVPQAPKRTSMSIADKIAQMKNRGGVAERLAKLQTGAGGGAAAPSGSPPSARNSSGPAGIVLFGAFEVLLSPSPVTVLPAALQPSPHFRYL